MSFLNITNPKERDEIVAKYLATVQRIKQRNMKERARGFLEHEAIEQSLEPVTRTAKESAHAITKELLPIKEGIEKMNANLMQINDPIVKEEDVSREKEEEKTNEGDVVQRIMKYTKDEDIDPYFSIIENENGDYQMGNTKVQIIKDNDLLVDGVKFNGTIGLWSLIMFKKPKEGNYSMKDLEEYQRLVEMTNVMSYPNNLRKNSNVKGTYKWRQIFQRFDELPHEGSGIKFLPGDIKGLQRKLFYLLGEFQAGNTSATRNEIVSISDELLRRKNISQSEYRRINDFLQQ
jgi:hypothetical protein